MSLEAEFQKRSQTSSKSWPVVQVDPYRELEDSMRCLRVARLNLRELQDALSNTAVKIRSCTNEYARASSGIFQERPLDDIKRDHQQAEKDFKELIPLHETARIMYTISRERVAWAKERMSHDNEEIYS